MERRHLAAAQLKTEDCQLKTNNLIPIQISLITFAVAVLLSGAAVVLAFFRRTPAAAVSFAAMVVAGLSGLAVFSGGQYWFWGVAAAIATAIRYVAEPEIPSPLRYYTVGGALAGAVVGLAINSAAAVTVASAVGAFLGFEAFRRTPGGSRTPLASPVPALAAVGLPAVVNFSMLMLILSQLLVPSVS